MTVEDALITKGMTVKLSEKCHTAIDYFKVAPEVITDCTTKQRYVLLVPRKSMLPKDVITLVVDKLKERGFTVQGAGQLIRVFL